MSNARTRADSDVQIGRLAVSGGRVVTPGGVLTDGHVVVDGRIAVVGGGPVPPVERVLDAGGGWIVPGFIDLQVNGGAGIDVTTAPERTGELGVELIRQGVTAFLPTVITAPAPRRSAALAAWASLTVPPAAAAPLGLHFEGPMLSPRRLGAHPGDLVVDPSAAVVDGWSRSRGVAMVTLAPERPGALGVIERLVAAGVVVAIGHTDATFDQVRRAVDAGATYVTHLFNAMRPFGHRDPGPVGATLGDDGLVAGLIVDGVHVDPAAVRMAWRALGPERTTLVTDAVAARGGDGSLGSVDLVATDPGAVRTAEGVLAGSLLTLDAALRNLVVMTGCSVPDAVRTVTSTPAAVLGLDDRGALVAGARGDVVVLDDSLAVRAVVLAGTVAWRAATP